MLRMLVTGGAGFIGSAVIRRAISEYSDISILNLDKLTYAGSLESLKSIDRNARYEFVKADICDENALRQIIKNFRPNVIMHLAAESHVDRSIASPDAFIETNVIGTYRLLEVAREYWESLDTGSRVQFRFHHVSTDEVYGDLCAEAPPFSETNAYKPSSPYSATKASSDHLVRSWFRTYGLPTFVTNCSNNYGPYQFPEKFMPVIISSALSGTRIPVYGDGLQIRDWLYVDDHADALLTVAGNARAGDTYNIGGWNEISNIDLVKEILSVIEELVPNESKEFEHYEDLIDYVDDRPGHDIRYAIDSSKIFQDLGWRPRETLSSGLRKTVSWYLANQDWVKRI